MDHCDHQKSDKEKKPKDDACESIAGTVPIDYNQPCHIIVLKRIRDCNKLVGIFLD